MASRRNLLKTTGLALASTGLASGIGAAKSNRGQNMELKALELREKNDWSVEKWQDFISNHGAEVYTAKDKVTHRVNQSDGPSTEKLDRHESVFTYTHTSWDTYGYDTVEIHWDHDASDVDDVGDGPVDTAAIAYSDSHYDRTYETSSWVYYGDDAEDPDGFDSKDPNHGASAAFHDGRYPSDNDGYFGIRVEPNYNYSSSQRELEFDYVHTWSEGKLDSVSIGEGGISFGFTSETERWDYETSFRESDLDATRDPGST